MTFKELSLQYTNCKSQPVQSNQETSVEKGYVKKPEPLMSCLLSGSREEVSGKCKTALENCKIDTYKPDIANHNTKYRIHNTQTIK